MFYETVTVERPKNTKIQSRNGIKYVYQVTDSIYDQNRKFTTEKRKLIGKMLDGINMNPNDAYFDFYPECEVNKKEKMPDFSDTVSVGTMSAIKKIMEELSIKNFIENTMGSEEIDGKQSFKIISDLVAYYMIYETSVSQHYENFARRHTIINEKIINDLDISKFLKNQITDTKISNFLSLWCKHNYQNTGIYLSYDSTNINTSSLGIEIAEFGHSKEDDNSPQVNISYALDQTNNTPLFYETYRGSINDVSEFEYMMSKAKEFGINRLKIIVDRGYFSKPNLVSMFINNYDYIMMVKTSMEVVKTKINDLKEKISSSSNYILEHEVFGTTIKGHLFNSEGIQTYFHIYQDEKRKGIEKRNLLNRVYKLEEELKQKTGKKISTVGRYNKYFSLELTAENQLVSFEMKNEIIDDEISNYGFFCLISSEELTAEQTLSIYRKRDSIEKMFRVLKSELNYDVFRVHNDSSVISKTFIMFIAGIVRNEIYKRLKELVKKDKKNFTVPSAIRILEDIEITKNSKNRYISKYALTSKQKSVLEALKIRENDINMMVNSFNSRF